MSGIINIKKRIAALEGEVVFHTEKNKGTQVFIRVPLKNSIPKQPDKPWEPLLSIQKLYNRTLQRLYLAMKKK